MSARRAAAATLVGGGCLLGPGVAAPSAYAGNGGGPVTLPAVPAPPRTLPGLGLRVRRDLLLHSIAPGPVAVAQHVDVAVGAAGQPTGVAVVQRLLVSGAGDFAIRQRGPAVSATAASGSDVSPLVQLGTVIWEGFSPGRKPLAGTVTLHPALERPRLPLAVSLRFTRADGRAEPLTSGLAAPARGTVTLTLTNRTGAVAQLSDGTGDVRAVAAALDRLRAAGSGDGDRRPPTAGDGLPRAVGGRQVGPQPAAVSAALRVDGTLTGPRSVSGPGAGTTSAGRIRIAGVLDSGSVSFTARLRRGQQLGLTLHVVPVVDGRLLQPPSGARTWRAWAAGHPSDAAVTRATTTLVTQAAVAARAAAYVPYLPTGLPGSARTDFRYRLIPPAAPPVAAAVTRTGARPGAIAATAVAAVMIVAIGLALRRHA